jgi:hypothetical protein
VLLDYLMEVTDDDLAGGKSVNWLAKEGAPFSIGKKADRDPGSFQAHLESANFLLGPGGRGQLAPTYRSAVSPLRQVLSDVIGWQATEGDRL